jgi:hypothetical protein
MFKYKQLPDRSARNGLAAAAKRLVNAGALGVR